MTLCCWKCGSALPSYDRNKIPFRAVCEKCLSDLHVCKNCQFWSPSRANECLVPGTDYVRDREANNFCEEFKLLGKPPTTGPSKESVINKLFTD